MISRSRRDAVGGVVAELFRHLRKPTRFGGGGGSSRNFQWSPQAKSNVYPTLSGDIHG